MILEHWQFIIIMIGIITTQKEKRQMVGFSSLVFMICSQLCTKAATGGVL